MSKKEILWFLPIFAFVLILYFPVFGVYFSQDDFFHFKASQTNGTIGAFVKLFGFSSFEERGYAFYRPIFREGLHNIYYLLFGLNHLPMRVLLLLFHLVNIVFVYLLTKKIFRKSMLSLFTAFFFGISSAHVGTLYYLAGGMEVAGATSFILLTLILFKSYLEKERLELKIFAIFTFLLALASHELASVTPLLLVGILFVQFPIKKFISKAPELLPFLIIWFVYLYLDIFKIGFLQQEQQYQPVFTLGKLLNSFAWYSVWSLGLPEMLVDFVRPGLSLNPNLTKFWGSYFQIIFPAFFLSIALFAVALIYLIIKNRRIFWDKRLWFLAFWFPLAISPVVIFPLHKSTHYLSVALPAFWGVVGFLILNAYWHVKKTYPISQLFLGGFIITLILLSVTSAWLGSKTYPAANRGRIAQKLLHDVLQKYPELPKGAAIYFMNDKAYPFIAKDWGGTSKQAAFVLNNSDALQLLYKDPMLKVFYEDLGGILENFPKQKVYSLVARIQ